MIEPDEPLSRRRASAAAAIALLGVGAVLALDQRDLLDQARIDGGPASAARLLHERQRYGPGDVGEFERLLRERGAAWAEPVFGELTSLAPTWSAYRYALGLLPLGRGEWAEADERFRLARELAPNDSALAERTGAAWVRVAAERAEPKLLLYALPHFRDAARLDERSLRRTWAVLAPIVGDVRRIEPLVPVSAAGRREYGFLLSAAGHHEEAIVELSRSVVDDGRTRDLAADEEAWFALGRSHLALAHVGDAETAFREGLRRSADPVARIRGLYDAYAAAGRAAEGLALWEALSDEFPRGARFNVGRAHFERGPSSHAAAFAEFRAVEDIAADPPTTGYLARIELDRRLFAAARTRLERALRRHPRDADLRYLLALALRGAGERRAARAELVRAQELSPANETFARLLARWDEEDGRR